METNESHILLRQTRKFKESTSTPTGLEEKITSKTHSVSSHPGITRKDLPAPFSTLSPCRHSFCSTSMRTEYRYVSKSPNKGDSLVS